MKGTFKHQGFTLIELLVTITIIILMTGVILNALSGSRAKARDAQRISDVGQLQLALALFVDRCGQYPSATVLDVSSGAPTTCPTNTSTGALYKLGDFIATIPHPPSGAADYDYDYYISGGKRTVYMLHTKLEGTNAAIAKGMNYSAVVDPTESYGSWRAAPISGTVWVNCSSAVSSVDYCLSSN